MLGDAAMQRFFADQPAVQRAAPELRAGVARWAPGDSMNLFDVLPLMRELSGTREPVLLEAEPRPPCVEYRFGEEGLVGAGRWLGSDHGWHFIDHGRWASRHERWVTRHIFERPDWELDRVWRDEVGEHGLELREMVARYGGYEAIRFLYRDGAVSERRRYFGDGEQQT